MYVSREYPNPLCDSGYVWLDVLSVYFTRVVELIIREVFNSDSTLSVNDPALVSLVKCAICAIASSKNWEYAGSSELSVGDRVLSGGCG